MVGVPFWLHSLVVFVIGSAIVNPTGWCLVGNSEATGGNSDNTIWFLVTGAAIFMIFYGIAIADAITDNGKKFAIHGVLIGGVFLFMMYLLVDGGHLYLETWEDWAWSLMLLGAMLAGLAKMEVAQGQG